MSDQQRTKLWLAICRSLDNVEQGRSPAEWLRYDAHSKEGTRKIIIAIAGWNEDEDEEDEDEH